MRRRLTKRELREDSFLRLARRIGEGWRENRIWIFVWATILLLLGTSGIGLFLLHRAEERDSFIEFTKAQSLFRDATTREEILKARDEFAKLLSRYTFTQARPLCLLYKGLCHYRLKEWENAILSLRGFYERYPRHWLAPSSIEAAANAFEQKGDYSEAISLYEYLVERYPHSFNAPHGQLSIGRCLMKLGELEKAKEAYRKVVSDWPDSVWVEDARLRLEAKE